MVIIMSKVTYNQSGYIGSSMSERAAQAYIDGEKPRSKWSKTAMLYALSEYLNDCGYDEALIEKFKSFKKAELFDKFFYCSSWHHTSKYANETDFYSIDESSLENLTNEDIQELLDEKPEPKKVRDKTRRKAEVSYSVWGGTRAHPKKYDYNEVCEIDDTWAYTSNGKKRLDGKYVTYKLIYDNQKGDKDLNENKEFSSLDSYGRYVYCSNKYDLINDLIDAGAFKESDYKKLMRKNLSEIKQLHYDYFFNGSLTEEFDDNFYKWLEDNFEEIQSKCCEYHLSYPPSPKCHGIVSGDGFNEPREFTCKHIEDCPYLEKFASQIK